MVFLKLKNNLSNGASFETMRLIVENAKPLKIKASGGGLRLHNYSKDARVR